MLRWLLKQEMGHSIANLTVALWASVPGQTDVLGNAAVLSLTDTNPPAPVFYRVSVRTP